MLQGSFLNIFNVGTLITGIPGIGKSECALLLLDRGHQIIADDAPLFERVHDRIIGSNPLPRPFLHVRSIGLVDVIAIYGTDSFKPSQELQLIIELKAYQGESSGGRVLDHQSTKDVFGCLIPIETIPIINPRNLEVLIETIVKRYLLKVNQECCSVASFDELLQQKMEQTHS